MCPGEVEHFSFWVFNLKTKFSKKIKSNVVTTKKMSVRSFKKLALDNKQAIVNKIK